MNKKEIREYIDKNYDNLVKMSFNLTFGSPNHQDILNDILYNLLNRNEYTEKIRSCYNLYNYLYAAIRQQYNSNNSDFHKKYRLNHYNIDDYEMVDTNKYSDVDILINYIRGKTYNLDKNKKKNYNKNIISKRLFIEYYVPSFFEPGLNKCSYKKLAEKYNIPAISIYLYIKQLTEEIKKDENIFNLFKKIKEYDG